MTAGGIYDTTGISTDVRVVDDERHRMGDRQARVLDRLRRGPYKNRRRLALDLPCGYRGDMSVGGSYRPIDLCIRRGWIHLASDGTISITDAGRDAVTRYYREDQTA